MDHHLMQNAEKYNMRHRRKKLWEKIVSFLGCLVVFCTTYALILPALTLEKSAYCGLEEHQHGEECYERVLVCGLEESETVVHIHDDGCYTWGMSLICPEEETFEGHTHTEDCVAVEQVLVCTDEDPEHEHTDACYETVERYICGLEEGAQYVHIHSDECYVRSRIDVPICGYEAGEIIAGGHVHTEECYELRLTCQQQEHVHTVSCFADPDADLESAVAWMRSVSGAEVTGVWREDLIAIAGTQLNYQESTRNYIVDAAGVQHGYSRYGAWYGDPYGDWDAMFVSFCMSYAKIPADVMPSEGSCAGWIMQLRNRGMYRDAMGYTPNTGDIVFFDLNGDGAVDHMGLVRMAANGMVYTIEGDAGVAVRAMEYYLTDGHILGYGVMPNSPMEEAAELERPEEENPAEEENPEEELVEEPAEELGGSEESGEEEPAKEAAKPSEDPEPIALEDVPDSVTAFAQLLPSPVSAPVQQILRTRSMTPMSMTAMGANSGIMALGLDEVPQTGGELDFEAWIKNVTLEYRTNQWSSWLPVTPDSVIDVSNELRIGLSYEVPGCSLSNGNRAISYQLPGGVKPEVECSGKVKNAQMATVGEYRIDTTGKITITFDEAYAAENSAGKIIEGAISCEVKVSSISTGGGSEVKLPFNDELTLTFKVEDQKQDERDLKVTKKAVKLSETDGTVQYTIEVTSEQGTDNEVYLHDVMTNIGLTGAITVDCGGGEYTIIQQSSGGFDIILPQMKANSKYTITYTAQLPNTNYETSVTAKNDVTATSEKNSGGELIGSDHTDTTFVKTYIEKSGSYKSGNGESDTIVWTITVNRSEQDISGWTLKDTMNGVSFAGPVTINPALPGVGTQITLPYTFPAGSTDMYTITYTTDAVKELGAGSTHNVAELIPPSSEGKPGYSADAWQGDWKEYNPLSKEAVKLENQGDGTAIIEWHVTIKADQGDISAPWTYHDALWNKQTFTAAQLAALEKELAKALSGMDYTFTPTYGNDPGFEIQFNTTLQKGQTIEFTYYSTAPLGDGNSPLTFKNTANINQKVYAQGQIDYKPSTVQVTKKDKNENGYGDTSHGYYDEKMTVNGVPGILQWYVNVAIPPEYNDGDLTLTETLPTGVELSELEIRAEGVTGAWNITDKTKAHAELTTLTRTEGANSWSIQTRQAGQVITIVIPEASLTAKRTDGSNAGQPLENIILVVRAKIPEDFNWPKSGDEERASFTNKVEVKTKGSTSSDQQTQTVVKNYSKEVLKKSAAEPMGTQKDQHVYEDNQIPYTIHINPEGRDLVENSDKIVLVDELRFENTDYNAQLGAGLMLNTLEVYYREADGSQGAKLESDRYSVQYETNDNESSGIAWDFTTYTVRRLRVTLPDQTPLIVKYTYQISGKENTWFDITNSAWLEGVGSSESDGLTKTSIQISQVGATANIKRVTLYKVDADDNKIPVPGAQFELFAYDREQQGYVSVGKGTTDNNGVLDLASVIPVNEPGKSGSLEYFTPYKLEETAAPKGYLKGEPYYFYVVDPSGGSFNKPPALEGVEWHAHQASDMIYYRDSQTTTSITVNKRWFNKDGSNATSTTTGAGAIQFNLYRLAPGGALSDSGTSDDMVQISFNLRNKNNPKLRWDGTAPGTKWVQKGALVTVSMSHPNFGTDYFDAAITVNDEPVNVSEGTPSNATNGCIHVFSFVAEGNVEIGGYVDWNPPSDVTISISAATKTLVEGSPYTITAGAGQTWETTISNLPRASEDGSVIYTYYVEELPVNGYDTTYENNGITSGTITIRNTSTTDSPHYELPETGGAGIKLYTVGGAVLVAGALTYKLIRRRKKEGECS